MEFQIGLSLRKLQYIVHKIIAEIWAGYHCCLSSCYFIYNAQKHIARGAYMEPLQWYMIELFAKSVLFSPKTFIIDVCHGSKCASELKR